MKKILLVDDEESIHLLYRDELEEAGYEVHSALSGDEALHTFDILKPDLIILDINMPGLNGIDTLRCMKEKTQTSPLSSAPPTRSSNRIWPPGPLTTILSSQPISAN